MDEHQIEIKLEQLRAEDQEKILQLVNLINANVPPQRFTPERREFIINRFITLFASGITSAQIFLTYSIRDLVELGFSIREAFILNRELSEKAFQAFPHLSNEELEMLKYDAQIEQLCLWKSPGVQQHQQNNKYVLIIGPENSGKTTFIFNLINAIYDVNVDSLFRVKKNGQQDGVQYDEYIVEMTEALNYVFVEFKGIGDIKNDIVGGSKNNLFITILNYIQNKEVLAAFFVNSSSINRLGQDEKYQLQRFFELFPKQFFDRLFLVLTYCTDNQPILTIYQHESSPTPQYLKNIIQQYNQAKLERRPFDESKIFWYGINNNFLYAHLEEYPPNIRSLCENYKNNKAKDFLQVQLLIRDGANLEQTVLDQDLQTMLQQGQQIDDIAELSSRKIQQLYYQLMRNCSDKILKKLEILAYQQPTQNQSFSRHLQNLLNLENSIIEFKSSSKSELGLFKTALNPSLQAIYIQSTNVNQRVELKATPGKKILYCRDCQQVCHYDCELYSFEDLAQVKKMCSQILVKFKSFNFMQISSRHIEVERLDSLYYCKACVHRDCQKEKQDSTDTCLLANHDLFPDVAIDQNIDIYHFNAQQNGENFYKDYTNYKKEKKVLRLSQQKQYQKQSVQAQKIVQIQDKIRKINRDSLGLIPLDLYVRYKQLVEVSKAEPGIISEDFQQTLITYGILCRQEIQNDIQYQPVIKVRARFIRPSLAQGDFDL